MAWFDAGVNLLDRRFESADIVANALSAGVDKLCVITTHPNEWDAARELHLTFPDNIVYTLGIHPHNAKDAKSEDFARLEQQINDDGVVAVGECGLDFNRDFSPRPRQVEVFEAQLAIAKKHNKPVYLHERDAFEQQIKCIEAHYKNAPLNGIAHCFTGTEEQLKTYLGKNLYIGITGWLCDEKRGGSLRNAILHLPEDKLVFETDAPYLFPKNVRSRKRNNEPALLPHIAQEYALLTGRSVSSLEHISYTNTLSLFGL